MITIVVLGLAALVVLALAVGLYDAAQAGRRRQIARDRREAWEQRRRAAATAPVRDAYPGV
jgi:type II secretory pathway pseudopilin PulG